MPADVETVGTRGATAAPVADPHAARDAAEGIRRRDFRRYWVSGAVDAMGSHAATIVVPLIVLGAGGSVTLAGGLATACIATETVVEPVAGVIADRVSRRRMMATSAVAAATAMIALAVIVAQDRYQLGVVIGVVLVESVAAASYAAAAQGAVRQLLPSADPQPALAALQARDQGAGLVGPSLGGLLFSLARWAPLLFNAVSYLVTAVAVIGIRTDLSPSAPEGTDSREGFVASFRAGVRLVFGHPFLRFAACWGAGVNAVFSTLYYVVLLDAGVGRSPAAAIGIVLGLASGMGLAGSLLAPAVLRRVTPTRLIALTSWVMVILVAAMAFTGSLYAHGVLLGTVLLISPAASILFQSYAIATIPVHMQGRAGGAMGVLFGLAQLVSPVAAGLLVQSLAGWAVMALLAGLLALLAVYTRTGTRALLECARAAAAPDPEA